MASVNWLKTIPTYDRGHLGKRWHWSFQLCQRICSTFPCSSIMPPSPSRTLWTQDRFWTSPPTTDQEVLRHPLGRQPPLPPCPEVRSTHERTQANTTLWGCLWLVSAWLQVWEDLDALVLPIWPWDVRTNKIFGAIAIGGVCWWWILMVFWKGEYGIIPMRLHRFYKNRRPKVLSRDLRDNRTSRHLHLSETQ